VVDRAVVCGVRAMAPRLHAGCRGTKDAALADRLPELLVQYPLRPNRPDNAVERLVESHSRNRILLKHYRNQIHFTTDQNLKFEKKIHKLTNS
jgi:hypothetical protein